MGKAWYMALREYNPNGKGKVVPMEFTLMVYSSYEKGMVLWKTIFRSGTGHGRWWKNTS